MIKKFYHRLLKGGALCFLSTIKSRVLDFHVIVINFLIKLGTNKIYITLANIDVENGMKSFRGFG